MYIQKKSSVPNSMWSMGLYQYGMVAKCFGVSGRARRDFRNVWFKFCHVTFLVPGIKWAELVPIAHVKRPKTHRTSPHENVSKISTSRDISFWPLAVAGLNRTFPPCKNQEKTTCMTWLDYDDRKSPLLRQSSPRTLIWRGYSRNDCKRRILLG